MKKLNREFWLKDVRETERKIRQLKSWIRQPQKAVPASSYSGRMTNIVSVMGEDKKVAHLNFELFKLQATVTALYMIRRVAKDKCHPVERCWTWFTYKTASGVKSPPYLRFSWPCASHDERRAANEVLRDFDVSKYFHEVPEVSP